MDLPFCLSLLVVTFFFCLVIVFYNLLCLSTTFPLYGHFLVIFGPWRVESVIFTSISALAHGTTGFPTSCPPRNSSKG
jgi:hypothetical protein